MSNISIIVCTDKNGIIGSSATNNMPWKVPSDLRYFRSKTLGKPVIMGHNTYKSIRLPLGGRYNYVISRTRPESSILTRSEKGFAIFKSSFHDAYVTSLQEHPDKEIFIIGGRQVYTQAMAHVRTIYKTVLDIESDGDIKFPSSFESDFTVVSSIKSFCHESGIMCTYQTLVRGLYA